MNNTIELDTECDIVLRVNSQSRHQARAREALGRRLGITISNGTWISTRCDSLWCIHPEHLIMRDAIKLHYPAGVCTYCGMPSRGSNRIELENVIVSVPACSECDRRLVRSVYTSITDRRRHVHRRIRQLKHEVLETVDLTDEELLEHGWTLRSFLELKREEKRGVLAQLAWPEDPDYDRRALERSGVLHEATQGFL